MIAAGLDDPTDLSFAPDGRIFIAERGGRVLVFHDGRLQPAPAITLSDATTADRQGLLGMAVDPRYQQNHFVYVVYTAASGFRLARFRGVGDTLGDRAILMEGVASRSARPTASLRFGPDGKLYAGFDDAGDALRAGDLGSFNGKILRLNADATTPADQPGGSPVYAANVNAPRAVDWDASGATLWVLEDAAGGSGKLQALVPEGGRERRSTAVMRYSLADGAGVAALAFYHGDLIPEFRGDLLLAADAEHAVLRLRFDAADPRKVVATERLLTDSLDGARTIGVGRDGAIYLCAVHALLRVAPAGR
jgi:glucose/arabinose dehydrogenase